MKGFWGQARLIMREKDEYPKLSHISPRNIPEQVIKPITQLIKKDQSNIEQSDRVRIVQVREEYLVLLIKISSARKAGAHRKFPVNWEVFYKYTIDPYKRR